jgi:hypothetical protein
MEETPMSDLELAKKLRRVRKGLLADAARWELRLSEDPLLQEVIDCARVRAERYLVQLRQLTTPKASIITPIVARAMREDFCCLGQISIQEKRQLDRAVRHGLISKGIGGPFPKLKTVYAPVGFDFAQDRENGIADLRRAHMIDLARGTAHFFPFVPFEKVGA